MSLDCSHRLLVLLRCPERALDISLTDWDSVLRLARRANLITRLAESLNHCCIMEALPELVKPHLIAALALSSHQRQAIVWEARHIGKALLPLNIPVVLLKGAAYAMANLNAARGRLFGDVDILVPASRINDVEAALMMHGWSSGHVDPYDNRYYRQWMHELPPMMHIRRGTTVDVHHNILPRTAQDMPEADRFFESAMALPDRPFHVLAPCDMVIHSATHLFHEGELNNGLRDLFDLADLLDEFSERDEYFWDAITERARELALEWPVRLAFRYLELLLEYPIPPDAKARLASGVFTDRLRDRLFIPSFQPDHPLCNSLMTSCARALLYLRGHYLRMTPNLLVVHLGRKAFMRLYKNTSRSR